MPTPGPIGVAKYVVICSTCDLESASLDKMNAMKGDKKMFSILNIWSTVLPILGDPHLLYSWDWAQGLLTWGVTG